MSTDLALSSTLRLNSGHHIPQLGFGVWKSPAHITAKSCLSALDLGYRHIDTAQGYKNEAEVGQAIQQTGVERSEVFLTSKIASQGDDAESTYQSIVQSIEKIGGRGGYLDLMLIHTPSPGPEGVKLIWQGLERLHSEGRLRSIGVSNFGVQDIQRMKEYAKVWPPAVNQLELHPWLQQREIVSFCNAHGIVVEAYCPLVRNKMADDETLCRIAAKHSKSTVQVLVRYSLQKGWIPLPKSDDVTRMAHNADVFDFALDEHDMKDLDAQDGKRGGPVVMAASNE